jgi:CHAD domain-containing protein
MGDKPAFHPDVAISRSLTEAALSVVEEAQAPLADPSFVDAEVVHDVRKALKRWRALLRLIEPFLDEAKELRLSARELARGLATARDMRSALDALSDLGDVPISARSLQTIHARIDREREQAETTVLTEAMREHLKTELKAAHDAVRDWSLRHRRFEDIADGLAETYNRARRDMPEDWVHASADDLHELRKRVVEHRYQMELIEPLWPKLGRLWVSEAQRLRDRLGRHHDLSVLAAQLRPKGPLAPWRDRLLPLVQQRQRKHAKTAARLARLLFAEKPNAFRNRLLRLWESRASAMAD